MPGQGNQTAAGFAEQVRIRAGVQRGADTPTESRSQVPDGQEKIGRRTRRLRESTMKRRSVLEKVLGIILLAMAMAGTESLLAQSGSFELLRAEYGAGDTWVDVTARVRSLVRGESLNIRVDNDTLGGDPNPGTAKTLRLRVRDDSGRERMLSYREKDVIGMAIRTNGPR